MHPTGPTGAATAAKSVRQWCDPYLLTNTCDFMLAKIVGPVSFKKNTTLEKTMASIPQTYTISDFLDWQRQKQLVLDPKFQRGSVWTPQAQTFLIDTILRKFPIPSIYLRTRINPSTQGSIREVVDGQQRLRAIIAFASNELRLNRRAPEIGGMRYNDLDDDVKADFLSYGITTVQLINASDADVLEVFARLNSYSVKVTPAELRHAKFDEPVKWAIWNTTRTWGVLWDEYHVVSIRDSVRLKNTTLIAEMYMALKNGIGDGGEDKVTGFYTACKKLSDDDFEPLTSQINTTVAEAIDWFGPLLAKTTFFDAPNFLMLITAIAFVKGIMPDSTVSADVMQLRGVGVDLDKARVQLGLLSAAVENEDVTGAYSAFVVASKSSTQRVSSRKVRFAYIARALAV